MRNSVRFFFCMIVVPLLVCGGVACNRPLGPSTATVAVTGKVPVIDVPTRPVLVSLDPDELTEYLKLPETVRKKLQSNDKALKMYAAQLLVGVEDYNVYAAVRNKTSEEAVGVKGSK